MFFSMLSVALVSTLAAPNIILISMDTTRADHLGFYGYEFDTSPNLDRLAEKSLVFDNMICEVPLTSPSFSSMMSSQYPRLTGTTRNGLRLPETVPVLAEQFKNAGYDTFCVQSNWTLKSDLSGLDRGFDIYHDAFHKKRWGVIKAERDAKEVTRIAKDLLESKTFEAPIFAWIHYSDPHAPYKLHRTFNVSRKLNDDRRRVQRVSRRYDSEIAYTDHHIGELLQSLPSENTILVFVGDHGESLWQHDYLGHGRHIYQSGLHVPFFIQGEGIDAGRSGLPVRGIDVAPTLLNLAGIIPSSTMQGLDVLDGTVSKDRVRVVETYGGAVPKLPGARALMANRPPMRQAALKDSWKFILGEHEESLFNLEDDPAELNNKTADHPEIADELRNRIVEWNTKHDRTSGDEAELSEDDIEALDSLGYID